jgi:hypothetical protein
VKNRNEKRILCCIFGEKIITFWRGKFEFFFVKFPFGFGLVTIFICIF